MNRLTGGKKGDSKRNAVTMKLIAARGYSTLENGIFSQKKAQEQTIKHS